MALQGVELPAIGEYGVGMIFLPKEHASRLACEQELARAVRAEGQVVLGWRDVAVDDAMPMSPTVREKEPVIRQIFIGRGPDIMVTDALERKLYVIRKSSGHAIQALKLLHGKEFFVPSMSARTVVYKGLLLADQVGVYYKDLQDPRCISALALVHQRFSTNTFPEWPLAHPYRLIAHNGEINTVKGNFNWMRAREGVMKSAVLGDDLQKLFPLIYEGQSDTACFDNALEFLQRGGYSLAHAVMMLIPEAWAWLGGFSKVFHNNITVSTLWLPGVANIPEYVFSMFQLTFAIITPALIAGAFAERMRFSASLLFFGLWHLIVY
eukprot:gene45532-60846_t